MKILKITKQSIKEVICVLRAGGVIVYPTETAYALGCDAANSRAKAKIFKIKKRPGDKNLPMICATKKMAADFFELGKMEKKLAKTYWPGPLTIILQPAVGSRQLATAVRVSPNRIARALSAGLGRPVVSTSANISGEKTLYDAKKIAEIFSRQKNKPDLILDAGKLPKRKPSTIVKIMGEKIDVVRQGEIKINSKFT